MSSQYITYKVVATAAVVLLATAAVSGWNIHAWAVNELNRKVDATDFIDQQSDTKWIKKCMITKCWDKPAPPP